MMVYVVSWLIIGYIVDLKHNFWQFLSYWTELLLVIYFTYAFGISLYAIIEKPVRMENNDGKNIKNREIIIQ